MEKKENVLKMKIDEKSLFYGCKNDFVKGHTATVSTPINQSKNPEKWHKDILSWIGTKAETYRNDVPEMLIDICQKASHSGNIIQNVFIFKNILVDGEKIDVDCSYIMYIKKETDKYIRSLKGKMVENTHLGRLKLHYPITFYYKSNDCYIDNEKILKTILEKNHGYAYIVRGFEYNIINETLNIITSIVGPKNALLSTIFRVAKGTGKKLRTNLDMISADELNFRLLDREDDDIQDDKFEMRNKSSRYNGKKGENFVYDLLINEGKDVYHTSVDYPTSPYDIEIEDEYGKKIYIEVKSTQGDKVYFRMSRYEYQFMEKYKESYILYMVMNVKEKFPNYKIFKYEDIMKLKKQILNYQFTE